MTDSLARDREAATREILEVISQSRDDDAPVFDAVLRNANRLCGTSMAYLALGRPDDTHMTLAAYVNPYLQSEDSVDEIIAFANQTRMRMDAAEHFSARAIVSGKVVQIADLARSQGYLSGEPTTRILVEDVGVRTILSVPMFDAQGAIGAISLQRREVRPFADDEIALIQSFAAQAVIAIENVRQFRELQTRLAREAATREILEVISQSRDDEMPVFDAILHRAADLCLAQAGALVLATAGDTHERLVAEYGLDPSTVAFYHRGEMRFDPDVSLAAKAILTGRSVHVEDLMDVEGYRDGAGINISAVQQSGIRTIMFVPLLTPAGAMGCINVVRKEVRPFTPDEIALVEIFAAQAVIAIENVRQFRELQTRLAREAATREILEVISQSRDDDKPVFDVVLRLSAHLCGASMASLSIVSEDRSHAVLVAHWGDMLRHLVVGTTVWPMESDSGSSTCIREGRILHEHDLADTDLYRSGDPVRVLAVDEEGIGTFLAVPLFSGDRTVGCIAVHRREVKPFTPDEIALLETFAAQAVIAIENVRQFRELQTRLAREAATREILEVISQSRDDDAPVFDVVLRKAAELSRASMANLEIISEDRSHAVMVAHWGDSLRHLVVGATTWPMDSELARAIYTGEGRVVHVHDLADTDLYRSGDAARIADVDLEGIRTFLAVPLCSGGRTVGCIAVYRREVKLFTSDEIALLETFAAQAVIAIENVRQFRELQTRLAREAATREILQIISQSRSDEGPVFDVILENACRLCNTPLADLILARIGDSHQVLAAQHGAKASAAQLYQTGGVPMDPAQSYGAQAISERKVIHLANMAESDLYRNGSAPVRHFVDDEGIRTILFVPLIANHEGIGVIALFRYAVDPFDADEIALVETFAAQAVIAIENVRQFKALEALNAELGDRVQAQVGEIERMGRLKRFLPAAVADAVVSSGSERMLKSHRALLGVLFCDMRGFTAFCETAEPEETIEVLQTYHEEMGRLINAHGAGVDHRMGDGIMVLFNDPLPCDDPAGTAVRLALAMRSRMAELCVRWKKIGHRLGFGVGIALGYANVGMVGSGGRQDYTASGTAVNLAKRLCDEALDGEILLSPRASIAVEDRYAVDSRGEMTLKGIREPVQVFRLADPVAGQLGEALTD